MKHKILHLVFILATCNSVANAQNILPIPPLDTGTWIGGVRAYNLLMTNDSTEFFLGVKTPTSGYNGTYLGPTLKMHQGDSIVLNVTNQLGENSTTHWHGFHVPAEMDGGPHQMIPDNTSWTATFEMLNLASTFWYHPHHKPTFWSDPNGTGGQVHRGLAGMIIVEDSVTDNLNLPKTYGIDDIPLIIQDRAFNPDGTFKEFLNLPTLVVRTGDTMLVNGAITPTHNTHAQMVRFRILNASNGRSYYLGFSDNRNFYQIGSDGGLLELPVALNRLRISPAERVEIIVDFSGDLNGTIDLLSYASELINVFPTYPPLLLDAMDTTDYRIMSFDVDSTSSNPIFSIPSALTTIPVYVETDAVNYISPRIFAIANGSPLATINGVSMDLNVINETIQLGDMEVWEITNSSGVAHPFHVHGAPFQILSRSNGPILPNEQGWKDVVLVPAAQGMGNLGRVKIIKPFLDFADSINPYMYHCHILEHEDRGMMGQYVVVDTTIGITGINELINPIRNTKLFPNPVSKQQTVKIEFSTTISDKYTLILMNQSGQIIRTYFDSKYIEYGIQQFELNTENIPTGTYFLSISSSQAKSVQKLIKIN